MLDEYKMLISNQFEAALCTLNACINPCPPTAWNEPVANLAYCQAVGSDGPKREEDEDALLATIQFVFRGMGLQSMVEADGEDYDESEYQNHPED